MDEIDQLIDEAVASYNGPEETTSEETEEVEEGAAPLDQDAQAATTEEEAPEKEDSPTKGSGKIQELVDKKYGGDWDKFTDSLYESWNSNSKLAKEIQELKTQLLKKPEEPELDDKEVTSPQLEWLNARAAQIERQERSNEANKAKLEKAYASLQRDIAKFEGRLEAADELDRPRIEDKLERLRALVDSKEESYQDLLEAAEKLSLDKQEVQAGLKIVKDQLTDQKRQQLLARREEQDGVRQTLIEFKDAVIASAAEFRIPKANLSHMANAIRGELAIHLRKLGPDAPAIDMAKAVRERVSAYASAMGLGKVPARVGKTPTTGNTPTKVNLSGLDGDGVKVKTAKDANKFVDEVFKRFGL